MAAFSRSAADYLRASDSRTNVVTNPSVETNTTGWGFGGAGTSIARITTDAWSGTACLQVTKAAVASSGANVNQSSRIPIASGQVYTASAYVKVPSGDENAGLRVVLVLSDETGTTVQTTSGGITTVTSAMGWTRLSATSAAAPSAAKFAYVAVLQPTAGTAGQRFLVDAVLLEQSNSVNAYFDGGTTDGIWQGTANASSSILGKGAASSGTRARSVADSVAASDSVAMVAEVSRTVTDAAAAADAVAAGAARVRGLADSVSSSDAVTWSAGVARTLADAVTVSDSLVRSVALSAVVVDAVTVAEDIDFMTGGNVHHEALLDESITAGSTVTQTVSTARSATDSTQLAEAVTGVGSAARAVSDALSVSDTVTGSTGSTNVHLTAAITGSITSSDQAAGTIAGSRPVTQTTSLSDTVAGLVAAARSISDLVEIADEIDRAAQLVAAAADTLILTPAVTVLSDQTVPAADSLHLADEVAWTAPTTPGQMAAAEAAGAAITSTIAAAAEITPAVVPVPSATGETSATSTMSSTTTTAATMTGA